MTLKQRLDQLEQQNQHIERKNRRLTAALTLMAVAMCAVVTVAATEWDSKQFHTVSALDVKAGYGYFDTITAERIVVKNDDGDLQTLMAAPVWYPGGDLRIINKTGEAVVTLGVDEYGNGVVGAYNRKGRGRTVQPGP